MNPFEKAIVARITAKVTDKAREPFLARGLTWTDKHEAALSEAVTHIVDNFGRAIRAKSLQHETLSIARKCMSVVRESTNDIIRDPMTSQSQRRDALQALEALGLCLADYDRLYHEDGRAKMP